VEKHRSVMLAEEIKKALGKAQVTQLKCSIATSKSSQRNPDRSGNLTRPSTGEIAYKMDFRSR